jgi:hypothetical protein
MRGGARLWLWAYKGEREKPANTQEIIQPQLAFPERVSSNVFGDDPSEGKRQ